MGSLVQVSILLSLSLIATGCGPTARPRVPHGPEVTASPLGPSFVLVAVPSDDDSLLGRVLPRLPQPGQSLDELAQPNPCVSLLEPVRQSAMNNAYENAEELTASARAKASLGTFGFSGDVNRATHFIYRVQTSQRQSRLDTVDYQKCCKEKGCGVGYVSTIVYGEGEYASGEEMSGSAGVDVAFAGGSGSVGLKVLHKRNVRGWIAAIVKLNDVNADTALSALGPAVSGLTAGEDVPSQVKSLYEQERIRIIGAKAEDENSKRPSYAFADGDGSITENEFVRRYGKMTGSQEVSDVESRRNWADLGYTMLGIGAIAGPTYGLCGGWKGFTTEIYSDRGSTLGSIACGTGVTLSYVGLLGAAINFFTDYDGEPNSHKLTQYDAKLLVSRYNRTLLRTIVRDVQRPERSSRSTFTIKPYVAPLSLGVWGHF